MLFLLSPAKSLDYASPLRGQAYSEPLFVKQSQQLIKVLRAYTPPQISQLMDLSDTLAGLNVARYQAWRSTASLKNARQAVLAFDGDVYDGLNARGLDEAALDWAQAHLCVLSGLYGVLRPLDLMQPYRLEMGTRLPTERGKDLYAFWGDAITDYPPHELVALVRWIQSDGILRTDEELIREAFEELPFQQLGSRIRQCLAEAVERAKRG